MIELDFVGFNELSDMRYDELKAHFEKTSEKMRELTTSMKLSAEQARDFLGEASDKASPTYRSKHHHARSIAGKARAAKRKKKRGRK